MKDNFDIAMKAILVFEGGRVDDPKDPGGRTNEGITQRVCDAWRANNGRSLPFDVYDITDADRDAIYRLQYADKVKFDALPPGVDFVMLDGAVNSGVRQAVLWCQRALGFTGKDVDGSLGEATFAAIQAADPTVLINGICDRRLAFLKALSTYARYGRGWSARVLQIRTIGLSLSAGIAKSAATISSEAPSRPATIADAKKIPAGSPGAGTAGIGAAAAAASGALQATKDQVEKLATIPHMGDAVASVQAWIDHGMVLLGFGGFVVASVGGAWFAWNRSRAAKLRDALDIPQPKGAA